MGSYALGKSENTIDINFPQGQPGVAAEIVVAIVGFFVYSLSDLGDGGEPL
jgi:hypothetical protein